MITRVYIDNFKSLVEFTLPPVGELTNFTCLIGLNGAGKTTVLQAFDFLSQLMCGQMTPWLTQRDWGKNELVSYLGKHSPVISFEVHLSVEDAQVVWRGRYNTSQLRCTSESVTRNGEDLFELKEGKISVRGGDEPPRVIDSLNFAFEGSVLSFLQPRILPKTVMQVKERLTGLKSLELLSPHLLRRKARAARDIGVGGEKLASFLDQLPDPSRESLSQKLREFYPHFRSWSVKSYRAGWKGLRVFEDYRGDSVVDASHLNDGMLRVIAVLAQAFASHSVVLFDEIENGINPELVRKLVGFLITCGKQIIVTTHSPLILNYIPDEIARNVVLLLYRTSDGCTKAMRYFDLPSAQKKLRVLGPGEVFADTPISALTDEIRAASHQQSNTHLP